MKLAATTVLFASTLLVGCGESRCSNDHDEFYRYWAEGVAPKGLVTLFVGRSELTQTCNEIGYLSSGGGFQSADVHHLEPRLELQHHELGGLEADRVEWRLRAIHGGAIDDVTLEIWPENERVFKSIPELYIEEHHLGRNVRFEASVHVLDPETGAEGWAHATGAAHIDTSRR